MRIVSFWTAGLKVPSQWSHHSLLTVSTGYKLYFSNGEKSRIRDAISNSSKDERINGDRMVRFVWIEDLSYDSIEKEETKLIY